MSLAKANHVHNNYLIALTEHLQLVEGSKKIRSDVEIKLSREEFRENIKQSFNGRRVPGAPRKPKARPRLAGYVPSSSMSINEFSQRMFGYAPAPTREYEVLEHDDMPELVDDYDIEESDYEQEEEVEEDVQEGRYPHWGEVQAQIYGGGNLVREIPGPRYNWGDVVESEETA